MRKIGIHFIIYLILTAKFHLLYVKEQGRSQEFCSGGASH